jgi:hypothetical protein
MSEETRDEFAAWRGLLRQPDALPEHGLTDREATWDKLFERLGERPRRLVFSYRVAAACLLILLIPAARFFQDRPAPGSHRPPGQPVVPLAVAPASRPQSTPRNPAAAAAVIPRPPIRRPQRNPDHLTKSPVLLHPASPEAADRNTPPPMLAVTQSPSLLPQQKTKKQWKVIDLNELDPRSQRQHTIATSRNSRPPGLTINLSTENR